jgi:hypothetical protein
MGVKYLLHPQDGRRLEFSEAPAILERDGVMPSYAVEAIIREYADEKPAFHVRPSDVSPMFVCRRQRVWMSTHDYGINPLDAEGMVEGSALHAQLRTHEIEVPTQQLEGRPLKDGGGYSIKETRLEVMGVPMRGRIDWLFEDRIEDLKTSTPFWAVKFGAKGSGERASTYIWTPKDDGASDVKNWQIQLSIYRILLEKSGREAPSMGRVWRRYSGVKSDKGRWKRFDFPLFNEAELDTLVGDWVRSLSEALAKAEVADSEAWRDTPADGRTMVGSRGNYWRCDPCPLKARCFSQDSLEVF